MSIPSAIVDEFSRKVRDRGQGYFVGGRVTIVDADDISVQARVRGSRFYTVNLEWSGGWLDFSCDCEFFDSWGNCKHVWATLLKADEKQLLPEPLDLDEDDPREIDDEYERPIPVGPQRKKTPPAPPEPQWKKTLKQLRESAAAHEYPQSQPPPVFPADRRIVYLIDVHTTLERGLGLAVEVMTQKHLRGGTWERPKATSLETEHWLQAPEESDRIIAQLLMGAMQNGFFSSSQRWYVIPGNRYESILKRMCDTGRCGLRFEPRQKDFTPIQWDDRGAWEFQVDLTRSAGEKFIVANGTFRRGEERMAIKEPTIVLPEGLIVTRSHAAPLTHHGAWGLIEAMRAGVEIKAPVEELPEFLDQFGSIPHLPRYQLAPEFQIKEVSFAPRPRIMITKSRSPWYPADRLAAELSFDYGGQVFRDDESMSAKFIPDQRRLIRRDSIFESLAHSRLEKLGLQRQWTGSARRDWVLRESQLLRVVMELTSEGWIVEAEGSIYRRPGNAKFEIRSSGIDWFELEGGIDFDGTLVPLPKLLAALQKGENIVRLDDGSIGMLPAEWLAKYAPLAGIGEASGDVLRFGKTQVGLLDALLASMPEARFDETFDRMRKELRAFEKIESADAPEGFGGTLRPYQRDGLGWLLFLERFGFGGCLADDMGLGKTVQVLALLEMRRRAQSGPALVVVPRSLVFNWKAEAQRFAPEMRVLDHTGITRTRAADHFSQFDLILTTYGTLRRDAAYLKDVEFDYVILDEAQAIKNSSTEAAKATRLLRGRHRLVLTGTPIENRLADLWSLFEFLNPGMLGAVSVFRNLVGNEKAAEGRQLLARALRPFILRRTKQQVAKDLPEKLEQTIVCDLDEAQRKLYDELRDHYRQSLLAKIDAIGMGKSKILVLEALLRLRQAACHPGLIDKSRAKESSAKLDALFEQLEEVLAEGHKALVFSQFTSFLSLLRTRLDKAETTYEYLDGKTRDRQARVERFQTDESCKLFLVSLKAGGVGLNLTAADYVFLLDPWWNPAVESQAIDRTHRIGQTRRVFAYRLIARDTVEEKVIQLQQSKRDLADAIITADNSVISKLAREDLELLLS